MKLWIKISTVLIAGIIFFTLITYMVMVHPIISKLDIENIRFESAANSTTGFPFSSVIKIQQPSLWQNDKQLWKGESVVVEWSIHRPTSITVRLKGKHIITLKNEDLKKRTPAKKIYLADTTGFIKLVHLHHIVLDILGHKIGLYTQSITNPDIHTKSLGVENLYISYDGPSYVEENTKGGNLNFSAENIDVPKVFNPPFKKPIERLSFKAVYNDRLHRYNVSNALLFWDDLRISGNGNTSKNTGEFILAVTGFEILMKQLYQNNQLSPDRLASLVRSFNKLQEQQKKGVHMPVYMPASYHNGIVKLMNNPIFTMPNLYSPELIKVRK